MEVYQASKHLHKTTECNIAVRISYSSGLHASSTKKNALKKKKCGRAADRRVKNRVRWSSFPSGGKHCKRRPQLGIKEGEITEKRAPCLLRGKNRWPRDPWRGKGGEVEHME